MPRRSPPWTLRLILGLMVAGLVLVGTELGLRLILGPPEPPILVEPRFHADGPAFDVVQGRVTPIYQRRDHVPPFGFEPTDGLPRVLVLGGSSVHGGSRLGHELEFPGQLERGLQWHGLPAEVINLGKPSLDSHGIRLIVDQALAFEPDLLVLYMGHNDLGNTTMEARYGDVGSALTVRTQVALRRSKLYETMVASAVKTLPPVQGDQTERWQSPPIDDAQRVLAAEAFRDNLVHMVRAARNRGSDVVLVTPISELSERPPSGTLCPEYEDLTMQPGDPDKPGASPEIDDALAQRPDCPQLLYTRGRRRLENGVPGACEDLLRASHLDPRPLTASEDMVDAIRAAARVSGAELFDLRAEVLAEQCVPPVDWFMDNVHFSELGHSEVADRLLPVVEARLRARIGAPAASAPSPTPRGR